MLVIQSIYYGGRELIKKIRVFATGDFVAVPNVGTKVRASAH